MISDYHKTHIGCVAAIKDVGIRDIYYITNDGYVYERIKNYDMGGVA